LLTDELSIRKSSEDDIASIEALYPAAFPDEDLLPVVRSLLRDPVVAMSLVATIDARIVGHVIFTRCSVVGDSANVSLLAPLAVAPARHGQGVGTAIVRAGFSELESAGVDRVFVLGDPDYYGRFGFLPDSQVEAPYPLPAEWGGAWQSRELGVGGTPCSGKLFVPPQWQERSLWAP
jgi:putative acetyltransferase